MAERDGHINAAQLTLIDVANHKRMKADAALQVLQLGGSSYARSWLTDVMHLESQVICSPWLRGLRGRLGSLLFLAESASLSTALSEACLGGDTRVAGA